MRVNHRLLRLAREAHGWSQRALAEQTTLGQGSVSKYEQGLQEPGEEQVAAMAAALGYPVSFFTQMDARPTTVLYRTRVLRSAKLEARVRARLNLARLVVGALLEDLDIDRVARFPEPDQHYESPTQAAAALRTAWGVVPGPVENVSQLLEFAGGVVIRADLGTDQAVAAYLHPLGDPIRWFVVNSRVHSGDRIRFSLAHELGHAVLHEAALIPETREAEAQVNDFAGAFLLPRTDLLAELPRRRLNLEDLLVLKRRFGVSMQAVVMTAHRAGAISKDEVTRLYRELSFRGWRASEPGEVPVEESLVLSQALTIHRREHGYTDEDLARIANVSTELLADLLPDYFRSPRDRSLRIVSSR